MTKVLNFLLALNNKLYNWPSHIVILLCWVVALSQGIGAGWFKIGIIFYVGLMIFRIIKDGIPVLTVWRTVPKLGFMVGFNICVVFGPLSPFLMLFLALASSSSKEDKKG